MKKLSTWWKNFNGASESENVKRLLQYSIYWVILMDEGKIASLMDLYSGECITFCGKIEEYEVYLD